MNEDGSLTPDLNVDASVHGVWRFGMFDAGDERVRSTMESVRDELTVKSSVGGVARYQNDYYHQVSGDIRNVPGNPWFICTLWLAQWYVALAESEADLKPARDDPGLGGGSRTAERHAGRAGASLFGRAAEREPADVESRGVRDDGAEVRGEGRADRLASAQRDVGLLRSDWHALQTGSRRCPELSRSRLATLKWTASYNDSADGRRHLGRAADCADGEHLGA